MDSKRNAICLRPDGGMSLYTFSDEADAGISLTTLHNVMEYRAMFEIVPHRDDIEGTPKPVIYADENGILSGLRPTRWADALSRIGYSCTKGTCGNLVMVAPADRNGEHVGYIDHNIVGCLRSECAKMSAERAMDRASTKRHSPLL